MELRLKKDNGNEIKEDEYKNENQEWNYDEDGR
jgi:hypothetical protein